ncbi:hypothetical protein AOQ84DRAFT_364350, partial [Glonium stellatum]
RLSLSNVTSSIAVVVHVDEVYKHPHAESPEAANQASAEIERPRHSCTNEYAAITGAWKAQSAIRMRKRPQEKATGNRILGQTACKAETSSRKYRVRRKGKIGGPQRSLAGPNSAYSGNLRQSRAGRHSVWKSGAERSPHVIVKLPVRSSIQPSIPP